MNDTGFGKGVKGSRRAGIVDVQLKERGKSVEERQTIYTSGDV